MKHLDDGELRRMVDEPQAFSQEQRAHAAGCAQCAQQLETMRAHSDFAARALAGEVAVDTARALARTRSRAAAAAPLAWMYRPLAAAAAAAIVVCALAFTPLGGYAGALLTIFQPREFVPIDVTQADLRRLRVAPQADQLGTLRVIEQQRRTSYASLDRARAHLSFTPRVPASVPSALGSQRTYIVSTPGEYEYTFSAVKAKRFEAKSGRTLPPMPASLNGAKVHVRVGEIFGADYGKQPGKHDDDDHQGLAVVEMQVPTVTSSGASFGQLERYMLAMPGISPDLATQLRELGDLQNRMPVPVNISKQNAQQVTVDGVQGLAIGDNTGLGAGVMWQKNGIVYGVMGGALTMDQVLALANGLR